MTARDVIVRYRLVIVLIVAAALPLLAPGDAPFVNDEAMLIGNALLHNAEGNLAKHGLMGTMGVVYGPLPTLFYQLMLAVTHNLVVIVFVKYLIATGLLLWVMVWLGRETGLVRWAGCLIAISPYVLIFHRSLWDDGFIIPLCAWLVLAYARFLRTEHVRWLALAAALCVVLVYTQFKVVFILIAASTACVAFSWKLMLRRWPLVLATLGVGALLCLPYLLYIMQNMASQADLATPRWRALATSLTIVRVFSFVGWADTYLPSLKSDSFLLPGALRALLIALTASIVPFVAIGLLRSILVMRAWAPDTRIRRYLILTSWLVIALQLAFFVGQGRNCSPHYMTAVWVAWFYLAWEAIDWLCTVRWGRWWAFTYSGAMLVLWVTALVHLHQVGGSREIMYGTVLSNQLEVARELVRHPTRQPIAVPVQNYREFPHTLAVLRQLEHSRLEAPPPVSENTYMLVTYRDPASPHSGWLRVIRSEEPFGPFLPRPAPPAEKAP